MSPNHAPDLAGAVAARADDHDGAQDVDRPAAAGPTPAGLPELTGGWLAGAWALVPLAMALAIGGFANSFTAVRDAVEPSFGPMAWTVPVLIDVGVAVFSGIDLLFTRLGMRLWWLRLVPWALIGATIWLNVADETTSVGIVAHAAPPILWVMVVELATHAMRARSGLDAETPVRRRAAGRMDKVRASRWLLSPWSTLVIRRWMILQEERSYERANARWWARKEAKWDLQDTYGPLLWRVRAPRRARGLYRWGHLTTAAATQSANGDLSKSSTLGWNAAGPDQSLIASRQRAGVRLRGPNRGPAAGQRRVRYIDFEEVANELRAGGHPVNRTLVMNRLRSRGMSLANSRADEYLGDC